jgi:SAM-dependent methyltransferase
MDKRKQTEQDHYQRAARFRGAAALGGDLALYGSEAVAAELRQPYLQFEKAVCSAVTRGSSVLDIGAGTGIHSLIAATRGSSVIAADITHASLVLAQARAEANRLPLTPVVADGELLPFPPDSFDVVSSAGSLYCFDFRALLREVVRVLMPTGVWVIVDSFDRNPVYRLNRAVGYLRGSRTRLAVTNIPNSKTLQLLRNSFQSVDVRFYGALTAIAPVLRAVLGAQSAARIVDAADRLLGPPEALAFKFVAVARGPNPKQGG